MPDPAVLTDLGRLHLAMLPPHLRDDPDYQGVIHPLAREVERLEGKIEEVRDQLRPLSATTLLKAWEAQFRLTIDPPGLSLAERYEKIRPRLLALVSGGEGRQWVVQAGLIVGPGFDYREHVPGDVTGPPEGTVRIVMPFPPSGSRYAEVAKRLREIVPAHLDIEFSNLGGFILDQSQMDEETLTI